MGRGFAARLVRPSRSSGPRRKGSRPPGELPARSRAHRAQKASSRWPPSPAVRPIHPRRSASHGWFIVNARGLSIRASDAPEHARRGARRSECGSFVSSYPWAGRRSRRRIAGTRAGRPQLGSARRQASNGRDRSPRRARDGPTGRAPASQCGTARRRGRRHFVGRTRAPRIGHAPRIQRERRRPRRGKHRRGQE
jgi:hypothetical protein